MVIMIILIILKILSWDFHVVVEKNIRIAAERMFKTKRLVIKANRFLLFRVSTLVLTLLT